MFLFWAWKGSGRTLVLLYIIIIGGVTFTERGSEEK
jgi:hypothetical protein